MEDLVALIAPRAAAFALVATRAAGVLAAAPPFAGEAMPVRVRAALAALLALALLPAAGAVDPAVSFPAAAAREALIGVAIGMAVRLAIGAAQSAGALAGLQMGLGFATVVDPLTQDDGAVLSRLLGSLALALFVTLDGHHLVIAGLADSLHAAPPGAPVRGASLSETVVRLGGGLFPAALLIAAPVAGAVLLVNLALGAVSRFAPQLGIFQIGFLIAIAGGMLVLWAATPSIAAAIGAKVRGVGDDIGTLVRSL